MSSGNIPHEDAPTLAQLDRFADKNLRTANDSVGVAIGYMDGCQQDVLGPNADRGFHTIALVFGPNQSDDLQQEEAIKPFFQGFKLQKSADKTDQAAYRQHLINALAEPETHQRLQVFALTYDESVAMAAKEALLQHCYGKGDRSRFYTEYQNRQNKQWMMSFPSFFISGEVAEGKINAILPMFIIAEFISSTHEIIEAMYQDLRQPYAGLFVLSDKLCGDGRDAAPKAAIVNAMLQSWYADRMRVKNYDHAPKRCGEFLADNISGMLNACARDVRHPGWEAVRQMRHGKALLWRLMDQNASFARMPTPTVPA